MLASLLIICLLLTVKASAASSIWTNCSSEAIDFLVPAEGGSYQAIGCTYTSIVKVTFAGIATDKSAEVVLKGGLVGPGNMTGIRLACPNSVTAASSGPVSISVSDLTFGNDASMWFTGALPPGSSLSITNNTFNFTHPGIFSTLIGSRLQVAGILITSTEPFTLLDETTIAVTGNTFIGNVVTAQTEFAGVFIYVSAAEQAAFTMSNKSSLIVNSNRVVNSSSVGIINVVYCYFDSSVATITLSGRSKIEAHNNTLYNSRSQSTVYVVNVDVLAAMSLADYSGLALVGNVMQNCNTTASAFVARVGANITASTSPLLHVDDLFLQSHSKLAIDGNEMRSCKVGNQAYVGLYVLITGSSGAKIELVSYSILSVSDNRLSGSSITNDAYAASVTQTTIAGNFSLSLSTSSSVLLSGNEMLNSTFVRATVAYFYNNVVYSKVPTKCSVALVDNSSVMLSSNAVVNCTATTGSVYIAFFTASITAGATIITLANRSTIDVSGNTAVNASFKTVLYAADVTLAITLPTASISINLQNNSSISLNANTVTSPYKTPGVNVAFISISTVTDGRVAIALADNSSLTFADNLITNCSVTGPLTAAYLSMECSSSTITLANDSKMDFSRNSITRSSAASDSFAVRLRINSPGSLVATLSGRSAITMNRNTAQNCSVIGTIFVVTVTFSSINTNISASDATISLSGNLEYHPTSASISVAVVTVDVKGFLSLQNSSKVLASGNSLAVPSQNALIRLFTEAGLSLSGGSAVVVTDNTLGASTTSQAVLLQLSTAPKVTIEQSYLTVARNIINKNTLLLSVVPYIDVIGGGLVDVNGNTINGASNNSLVEFSGGLGLNGLLLFEENILTVPTRNYTVVTAALLNYGPLARVKACANELPTTLNLPLQMRPPSLEALIGLCGSGTVTPSLRPTISRPQSSSQSVILSQSTVGARNGSKSSNLSQSHTVLTVHTISHAPNKFSVSILLSDGATTPSKTIAIQPTGVVSQVDASSTIPTTSMPPSPSSFPTTNTSTQQPTPQPSTMCLVAAACQSIYILKGPSVLETCEGAGDDISEVSAAIPPGLFLPTVSYIGSDADQAAIKALFSGGPALMLGTYTYGSVVVVWPNASANVTSVSAASPSVAACWVQSRNESSALIHVAIEPLSLPSGDTVSIESIPVALLRISFSVTCPFDAILYNRTVALGRPVVLQPRKAFIPETAVRNTAAAAGALSVTVGAVAVPIAALQQGVALALVRMAQCEEDALNGEELSVPVHPLQFGIGGGAGRYARGAVVGNLLLIPAAWCLFGYLLGPHAFRALTGRSLAVGRYFVGWPGVALVPFAVLSEGSAMSTVGLVARANTIDVVVGLLGLAVLLVTGARWAVELWRMQSRLACVRVARRCLLPKLLLPRSEWEAIAGATYLPVGYLDERISLVGSSWWLWSAFAAHVLSMVVGVSEAIPITAGNCRTRWAFASAAAVLQAGVVMTNTVAIELLLLGAVGGLSCVLVVFVAFATFNVGSSDMTYSALNAVGLANSFLGFSLLFVGVFTAICKVMRQQTRQKDRSGLTIDSFSINGSFASPLYFPVREDVTEASAERGREMSTDTVEMRSVSSMQPEVEGTFPEQSASRYPLMPSQWSAILEEADDVAATKKK